MVLIFASVGICADLLRCHLLGACYITDTGHSAVNVLTLPPGFEIWERQACKKAQFSSVTQSCHSLWPHGLQHTRLPFPSPSPGGCSNSCPSSWWCHPTISSSVVPFSSCLQSFPSIRVFSNDQFFALGGKSIGVSASASVLPMNIQDWFSLGWTALISLQSKGLSRVFSSTIIWKHQFFNGPTLTSIHDCWLNHSFDYMDLCQQSDVSAF